MTLQWGTADDPDVVHAIIEHSDRAAAERTGTAAPRRRIETSRRLVAARAVRLGTWDGRAVATVAVAPIPSFDPAEAGLPDLADAWYMQRLAVVPDAPDPLIGFHAVRHAVETARSGRASVLRAEANPDLDTVLRMLGAVGFVRIRTADADGPLRRTFLQLPLRR